jgi:hypothetical protein
MVHLIESHAEELACGLMKKIERDAALVDLRRVPAEELKQHAHDLYGHLGEWLMTKSPFDLHSKYSSIGARWAAQGVPCSQILLAILAIKEYLSEFLRWEVLVDGPVQLSAELQLAQILDQFFDRAMYRAVRHCECAKAVDAPTS